MDIVVLVKQVPDTYSERRLREQDGLIDRESGDAVLDEINEKAVEAALQLKDAHEGSTVTVLTVGPDQVAEDRKSTRLNSSHVEISYAVFCLKKKTIKTSMTSRYNHDVT